MPATGAVTGGATFGLLDWTVVIAYLAVVLAVGAWAARGQADRRDYFLGGRQLSWWVVGLSILATETSALTFIGVPAIAFGSLAFEDGAFSVTGGSLFFINLIVGYVIGRVLIALYIVPLYFTGDVYTPFQLINRAFGRPARLTGAVLSLVGVALGAGVRVLVTAIPVTVVLQTTLPWWNMTLSIVLIMVAALVYTAAGGIKAVVWTDMIQYFIFVFGGLFALLYIPTLLTGDLAAPSGATGWAALREAAGSHLDWWNPGILTGEALTAAAGPDPGIGAVLRAQLAEIFTGPFNLIMGIFPGTIGIILAFGFDQLNVQRVLGCRNVADGRKAMLLSAALIFPQMLLFLLIGAALYAYYSLNGFDFGLPPWDPATAAEGGIGKPRSDFVFPVFIVTEIPALFKGFLIAGILAAAMSSVSSALSAMASIFVVDLYRPFRKAAQSAGEELAFSRLVTVASGVLLGLIAFACMGAEFLLELAFMMAGLTGGAILGAFAFGMILGRAHHIPVIAGMLASFVFMVAYNVLRRNGWNDINWPWDATIGMVVFLVVAFALLPAFPNATSRGLREMDDEG